MTCIGVPVPSTLKRTVFHETCWGAWSPSSSQELENLEFLQAKGSEFTDKKLIEAGSGSCGPSVSESKGGRLWGEP